MMASRQDIANVSDDLLTVHGVAPGTKPEGCSRLYHENIDGLRCQIMGNEKLGKAKEIIDELGADSADHRAAISQRFDA